MVAAEEKGVAGATSNRRHPAPVRLDARRARIVKAPAVHPSPEVRIELEVAAAPLSAHDAKQLLEVRLRARMRAVDRIPRTAAPAPERDAIGSEGRAVGASHEPLRMLLEDRGLLFG